jgi:hypothetical protein
MVYAYGQHNIALTGDDWTASLTVRAACRSTTPAIAGGPGKASRKPSIHRPGHHAQLQGRQDVGEHGQSAERQSLAEVAPR